VSKKIEGRVKLEDRERVYKESVKKIMKEFIRNLDRDLEFGFEEAFNSLKWAVEAENNKV
jgi:hypothetical protein